MAAGGGIYVSAGENHGGALLGLTPAGDGFDVKEVWASQGVRSTLRTEWQTAIVLDGHLYGFDNVGAAGPVTHLTCIHAATGERVWQQQRFGKGNMIAADGKLWCSMMNGELIVVRATPKAYEELGRADVGIRKVIAKNYNGDGISWQICHDVTVEACESRDHSGLGLHPGSGSQRPLIRGNKVVGNHIGIFFCWGVKYGLAEGNIVEDTKTAGISVGHRDTDNLVVGNTIARSKDVGILFRPERGKDFAGHRNRIVRNKLIDNGHAKSAAIDIQGGTEDIILEGNEFVESRPRPPNINTRSRIGSYASA